MQVHLGGHLLGQAQPALVVLEAPVGVDARLHADLGGAELDGLLHPAHELLAVVLVGIGRAPPWPNPQNAQPTVHTLDTLMLRLTTKVTSVPNQLGTQLVGGPADVLDGLRRRSANRAVFVGRQRLTVSALARWRRARDRSESGAPHGAPTPPGDEAPIRSQ